MSYTALIFLTFCFGFLASAQTIDLNACPATINTTTSDPPVLNTPASTLVGDRFTVNWIWSLTKTRDQTPSFKFGSCAFDVPNTTVASSCSFNQSAEVSWQSLLANCGWAQIGTNNDGDVQYGGNMTVNATETFQDQRNQSQTRTLSYSFTFVVSFPQDISVDATIQVFSPILVDKFVLAQFYTTSVSNGTVDFRSVVEFPWKITLINNTVNVGNGTLSLTTASVGPNPINEGTITTELGTVSTQNWEILIHPGPDVCDLTDSYTVFGTLTCVLADQTLCPTLPGPPAVTFVFNINSQSFCPTANNDVQLTGTLSIFDDDQFTNPKTQFILGTESYFRLAVQSTAVTVTDIVIDSVTVTAQTQAADISVLSLGAPVASLVIFDSAGWNTVQTGLGTAQMLTPVGATQRFHFPLNNQLFLIGQDKAVNITITAKANVTYLGTPVAKKRTELFVFQVNNQLQSFGSVFSVTGNNAQSLFASFFLVVLALCFWA